MHYAQKGNIPAKLQGPRGIFAVAEPEVSTRKKMNADVDYICNIESQHELNYIQDTLYVISGKWKLQIMVAIINGHHRYRDIARAIPGINFKMLSKELREMELNKLIERSVDAGPPEIIEYLPTNYCRSLYPLLEQMISWAKHHRTVI